MRHLVLSKKGEKRMKLSRWGAEAKSCFVIALFLGLCQPGQASYTQFDQWIKNPMGFSREVPENGSGVISVGIGNFPPIQKAFGFSNIHSKVQNQLTTQFPIASLTKMFTATAILKLAQQGRISLEDPVIRYLPQLNTAQLQPEGRKLSSITIHHLLTHSSGLSNYLNFLKFDSIYKSDALFEALKKTVMTFNPGDHYEYSGTGYNLLGMILEKILSRPFEQLVRDEIFRPLQMDSTYCPKTLLSQEIAVHSQIAAAYTLRAYLANKNQFTPGDEVNLSTAFAEGGCISTVTDLDRFLKGLTDGRILNSVFLAKMETAQIKIPGLAEQFYGYGIIVDHPKQGEEMTLYHDGKIGGYQSIAMMIPSKQARIVILSNVLNWDLSALVRKAVEKL